MSYVILVTGSQDWNDYGEIFKALADYAGQPDLVIRHGDCEVGADALADRAARELGFERDRNPADWSKCGPGCKPGHRKVNRRGSEYCPVAGYTRNALMVNKDPKPNICHAFGMRCTRYGGNCNLVPGRHISHGTRHCAYLADQAGIEVVRHKAGF